MEIIVPPERRAIFSLIQKVSPIRFGIQTIFFLKIMKRFLQKIYFRVTPKLSIIPGIRFENITTKAEGEYTNVVFDLSGNPINPEKVIDNKSNTRSFLLGGIGATYNITQPIQVYVNFSQNYKAINFNDLRTLNPNLKG